MEKIFKKPENVEVSVEEKKVTVKGPLGELTRDFNDPRFNRKIKIEINDEIKISSDSERRKIKAMVGTISTHIKNMCIGVSKGFVYKLRINSTHFPMTVEEKNGEMIIKNFVGEKTHRKINLRGEIETKISKEEIILKGMDKEAVAQNAANLEAATRLPGKDRRIFGDGLFIEKRGVSDEV